MGGPRGPDDVSQRTGERRRIVSHHSTFAMTTRLIARTLPSTSDAGPMARLHEKYHVSTSLSSGRDKPGGLTDQDEGLVAGAQLLERDNGPPTQARDSPRQMWSGAAECGICRGRAARGRRRQASSDQVIGQSSQMLMRLFGHGARP